MTTNARKERRRPLQELYNTNLQKGGGGGWGLPSVSNPKVASGQGVKVNPFILPKDSGLNIISKTFTNNYYVEWDLTTWRYACDQAIKMGYPISIAALYSWCYEASSFVRSLFNDFEDMASGADIQFVDKNENIIQSFTKEICQSTWFAKLKTEILHATGWGFSGINIDPIEGDIYKYPIQDIDPINRMLRQSTYNVFDGVYFKDFANLIFLQRNTNYEGFLGWMQPVARDFIQMNMNDVNWGMAGKKLAFPLLTIGYPENEAKQDSAGNFINASKIQAENVLRNIDPTNGLVYPYTRNPDGSIMKALEVNFEKAGTSVGTHQIYMQFNDKKKNDIREMIFGESLTSTSGERGSYALGEVHERKHERRENTYVDYLLRTLNDICLPKIAQFYKDFPTDAKFKLNKVKKYQIDEVVKISQVAFQNQKQLTDDFFESIGIPKEFIEEAPKQQVAPKEKQPIETESTGLKKKFF